MMISYHKWHIGRLLLCLITLLSVVSVALLTIQVEYVHGPSDHATIIKSEPHKYYVHFTRNPQAHRFHWTTKDKIQSDVRLVSQVNSTYFSISPSKKGESIIAKMMMDRLLMPIKLTSTFI